MDEPRQVTAGDTWIWTRAGAGTDYPASAGWTLTYYLSIGAETPQTIVAVADLDDFDVTVQPAADDVWTPGDYHWTARVKNAAGETHTLGTGVLRVLPDPTTAADRRTPAEMALAAVTAVLAKRMGDSIVEYEIDGVKAKHLAHADLLKLQAIYAAKVRRERGASCARLIPVGWNRV